MLILALCSFLPLKKPPNKYLYIPFESFHPQGTRGPLLEANSSTFKAFSEMQEILEVPAASQLSSWVLLPSFSEVKYSSRT